MRVLEMPYEQRKSDERKFFEGLTGPMASAADGGAEAKA
jgi:hypothetical protein